MSLPPNPEELPRDYEQLPEAVRQYYTPEQWLWLSDGEKARLQQSETEPDPED